MPTVSVASARHGHAGRLGTRAAPLGACWCAPSGRAQLAGQAGWQAWKHRAGASPPRFSERGRSREEQVKSVPPADAWPAPAHTVPEHCDRMAWAGF